MHIPSIAVDGLALLALAGAALAFQMRSGTTIFNGGILVAIGLLIGAALPILSDLPWAELAGKASDQAIAALQFLEVAYVILTL